MTESEAATTQFCARVLGPLFLIIGAIVVVRFDDLALMIAGILQDAPLAFVTGIFTLIVGVILFVAHHHWSGATAIVISVLLMVVPGLAASVAAQFLEAGPGVWIAGAVTILIGLWLTFAGWFAGTR
jgi:uncharacterized membrane protein